MIFEPEQIESFLLALHNIARAFGALVLILGIYPWLGGFEGKSKHTVKIVKDNQEAGSNEF